MSDNRTNKQRMAWSLEHGICVFPDCGRPASDDPGDPFPMCAPHLEYNTAQADLDQVRMSINVLAPWVDSCEAIGFDPLTKVMQIALDDLHEQKETHLERMERAGREIDED